MTRIPLIEPDDAGADVAAVYQRMQDRGFGIMNVTKLFANDARFLAGFEQMLYAIYADDTLAPRYRELAWLQTSNLNACHY